MAPPPDRVARTMLSRHSLELISCTTIQTLWAGYGQICAITAKAMTDEAAKYLDQLFGVQVQVQSSSSSAGAGTGTVYPLILKLISPPQQQQNTAKGEDEGHLRKMLSYEVEQCFYSEVVPRFGGDGVAVAGCLASTREMTGSENGAEELDDGLMAIIMVDLRVKYPVAGEKRSVLSAVQVHGALDWLAGFHGRSWSLLLQLPDRLDAYVLPPLEEARRRRRRQEGSKKNSAGSGLWLNGGYTYLATRRKEYESLARDTYSEWSDALCKNPTGSSMSIAEMVALFLTPCGRPVESYIHGDVKSENLFTTKDGDEVAFFDFQYVGLGLGVCDLAKLFTCSVPLDMLVDDAGGPLPEQLEMCDGEKELLQRYRSGLIKYREATSYEWSTFRRHWETALVDWCRFQASWGFWGNNEWLEARVRSIVSDQEWRDWLGQEIEGRIYE